MALISFKNKLLWLKQKILAIILGLTSLTTNGQSIPTLAAQPIPESSIIATINKNTITAHKPGPLCILTGGPMLETGRKVVVVGERECIPRYSGKKESHYEVAVNGQILFVEKRFVEIDPAYLEKIIILTPETPADHINQAIKTSKDMRTNDLAKVFAAVKATKNSGLTILQTKIADVSEYTQGTSFEISVINPTEKPIKYITISLVGLNAVGDPVRDRIKGGPHLTVRAIGPIETSRSASYKWEYMWHTDVVESFRITQLRVEYMDKSVKIIKDWKTILLPDELLNLLQQEL